MSHENLKEVEIITQRREDFSEGIETQPKNTFNEEQRGISQNDQDSPDLRAEQEQKSSHSPAKSNLSKLQQQKSSQNNNTNQSISPHLRQDSKEKQSPSHPTQQQLSQKISKIDVDIGIPEQEINTQRLQILPKEEINHSDHNGNLNQEQKKLMEQTTQDHNRPSVDVSAIPGKKEELDVFKDEEQNKKIKFPFLLRILDDLYFQIIVTIFTIYALFGDDIRIMAFDVYADIVFDGLTITALILFTIEIILAVLVRDDYVCGFFFWLDIISTVSLLLDIQLITKSLFYGSGANTAQLARAGKASRVGTKAGRVVRLVRLIRIVKLYKASQQEDKGDEGDAVSKFAERRAKKKKIHPTKQQGIENELKDGEIQKDSVVERTGQSKLSVKGANPDNTKGEKKKLDLNAKEFKESRVSKRLSDLTTRRVIIIVLLLLFIMPLFSADYFFDPPTSMEFSMQNFKTMSEQPSNRSQLSNFFTHIVNIHNISKIKTPIVYFSTPLTYIKNFEDADYNTLREDEKEATGYQLDKDIYAKAHPEEAEEIKKLGLLDDEGLQINGVLNKKSYSIVTAGLSLGRTIFVCFVLTMGALAFSKDATDLALRPIERMILKVNKIATNPISAKEEKLVKAEDGKAEQYETIIIENAIIKIGQLLALGFGDAGSEIIGSNMAKSGDVDPMIPGKKKCAIYGFCDIRNFTDATEQLQEDVMLFVNNIGEVVHSMIDRFAGAANKNIGDAFLLVWKIPPEKYTIEEPSNNVVFHDNRYISTLSDFALLSFMKIWAKLNRQPNILLYRLDKRLLARMKGYRVKLGMGLHIGWGIEGAIGSEFKIDASYLSPQVNMASRLEAGTKLFGVPLLISSYLQEQFTPQLKRFVRYIDRVCIKGSNVPMGLYTIDMDTELPRSKENEVYEREGFSKSDRQQIERLKKKDVMAFLEDPEDNEWDAEEFIKGNKDLRLMMAGFNEKFQNLYSEGFHQYLNGEWEKSKQTLEEVYKIVPGDGPTTNLMDVMKEFKFKAPVDWPGYRMCLGL